MGGSGTVGNFTMYVNPFMVVTNMKFTKHFYIEGQRIVSKLGEMGEYQYLLHPKDSTAGGNTIDFDLKGKDLKEAIYANFADLGLDGAVFTAGKSGKVPYGKLKKCFRNQNLVNSGAGSQPDNDEQPGNKIEKLQFYYHPDHLGSSSYISDISGEVYQHMELERSGNRQRQLNPNKGWQYFPFGETFIEERTDAEYTSYLYNGKELDEETGLYYYGARYYDPRISMFYGVDPLAERGSEWSPYAYAFNNPILFVDPDGMRPWKSLVQGRVYSSRTGDAAFQSNRTNPVDGVVRNHNGIDLGYHPSHGKLKGGEGVHSAARGVVKETGYSKSAGNYIIVQHEKGYTTHYMHLQDGGVLFETGQKIKDGDIIGEIGSTGRSTGNHLHFEIRLDGVAIDPTTIDDLDVFIHGAKGLGLNLDNIGSLMDEMYMLNEQIRNGSIDPMQGEYEMDLLYDELDEIN
jgi:RHS repeat-associated protein